MIQQIILVLIFIGFQGTTYGTNTWRTNQRFYMTDRLYKQTDGFEICCNWRKEFRLAEIDSAGKSREVREFLFRNAGRPGACPFRDYVWGKDGGKPMNYTNWRKTPAPGDINEAEWCDLGVIVRDSPPAKWDLVRQDTLHHVLCELSN
ncbi:unnamed protein product [Allacma fusca]|uniref:C-type lectin domain-containing protein n=1 Tax=Allacma fusca TaxID=39272 RepID=A0A8J2JTT6_9HEXA|nr:unnamed protein product [Allacma fusca]